MKNINQLTKISANQKHKPIRLMTFVAANMLCLAEIRNRQMLVFLFKQRQQDIDHRERYLPVELEEPCRFCCWLKQSASVFQGGQL